MKKTNKSIEEQLRNVKFRELSDRESVHAWNKINANLESQPFFLFPTLPTKRKIMIPLLIAALMFASVGGTAAASNSAVPGDTLFGVDRAVENVRLILAGDAKAELKVRFAEERLAEVKELIARARAQAAATTTPKSNATSTKATTTPRVNGKVAVGVNVAINFLNDVAADLSASGNTEAAAEVNALVGRLETMVNDPDVRVALKQNGAFQLRLKSVNASSTASSSAGIKINTNGKKSRIEVREDGERIRIEIKDNGDVKVKTKVDADTRPKIDNDDDDDDDEDRDDDNRRGKNELRLNSGLKIELR